MGGIATIKRVDAAGGNAFSIYVQSTTRCFVLIVYSCSEQTHSHSQRVIYGHVVRASPRPFLSL